MDPNTPTPPPPAPRQPGRGPRFIVSWPVLLASVVFWVCVALAVRACD